MKPMTGDTMEAMEVIRPMADVLNIRVRADGHFLYCNGQAIGIAANSAYATVVEFVAYAMAWLDKREYRFGGTVKRDLAAAIRRYWCSDETVEKMREMDAAEDAAEQQEPPYPGCEGCPKQSDAERCPCYEYERWNARKG